MNDEKIEELWKWFISNEQKIIDCIKNDFAIDRDYIIENIDNLILDLGMFTWEIGAGIDKPWVFTISPNGDKDLLKKSRKIIYNAPELKDWEINYCKPAKDWNYKFNIFDNLMNEYKINASTWNYVALQKGDDIIELIIEAENIGDLDSETAKTAADLVVLNEIGEETKIQKISAINIVNQLESEYDSHKSEIKDLKKYLNENR